MLNRSVGVNVQMFENVIENLFLIVIVGNDISIELGFQLKTHRFDVDDIVADLNWWCYRRFGIFLNAILARFGN